MSIGFSGIDRSVFENLKASLGAEFMVELIDAFLEDGPRQIDQMRVALAADNVEDFRRAAHSLKSNGATLGALDLSELAKELEMLGKESRLQDVGNRLTTVEEVYTQVAQALKALKS